MKNYMLILTKEERQYLYKAPVYVSLLGALENGDITSNEIKEASEMVHYRTFTSDEILHEYYEKVQQSFNSNIKKEKMMLPSDETQAKKILHKKLEDINTILTKVKSKFSIKLKKSLYSLANHIANTENNWTQAISILVDPFIDTPDLQISKDLFNRID